MTRVITVIRVFSGAIRAIMVIRVIRVIKEVITTYIIKYNIFKQTKIKSKQIKSKHIHINTPYRNFAAFSGQHGVRRCLKKLLVFKRILVFLGVFSNQVVNRAKNYIFF